jgi:hypothetical protein
MCSCLRPQRVEVVSYHANEAINRAAQSNLYTTFSLSRILSRYNPIRRNIVSGQKILDVANIFAQYARNFRRHCLFFSNGVFPFCFLYLYCDMKPESRNSDVGARLPLLGNGSVIMSPRQQILTRYNK